jgi:membrane protein required for colicin V production
MSVALIFDLVVIIAVLMSAGTGFLRGFIRESMTLAGTIGGAIAAFFFGPSLKPFFLDLLLEKTAADGDAPGMVFGAIPADIVAAALGYVTVFLAVVIVLKIISHFLAKGASALGLGPIDRTMGVIFGLARGVLLVGLIFLVPHMMLDEKTKKTYLDGSQTYFYVDAVSSWIADILPFGDAGAAVSSTTDDAREMLEKLDVLETQQKGDAATSPPPDNEPAPNDTAPPKDENLSTPPPAINDTDRAKLENLLPQPDAPVNE